jgi:hypothetical protein
MREPRSVSGTLIRLATQRVGIVKSFAVCSDVAMSQPSTRPTLYKGYRFSPEIISRCVWLYSKLVGFSTEEISEFSRHSEIIGSSGYWFSASRRLRLLNRSPSTGTAGRVSFGGAAAGQRGYRVLPSRADGRPLAATALWSS